MNRLLSWIMLIVFSVALGFAAYAVNIWYLFPNSESRASDALFAEGFIAILMGVMFMVGSGGLNQASGRAAMMAARANAFDGDHVGPSEVYKRDAWKPQGLLALGAVFVIVGTILLVAYFLRV